MVRVGINGFGRVGRQVFKIGIEREGLEFVAINDITDARTLAYLLKYDSIYGKYEGEVYAEADTIVVNGKSVKVFTERDPSKIPWGELGVDIVVEATGLFRSKEKASLHIRDTVKKVVITAPGRGEPPDITIVMGVNEDKYDHEKHHIVSNASCTTNAFAHVVKVLHENFGIERGLMTTIHAFTNDQRILDQPHSDLRRARAAALSIIPTSTGAAKAIGLIFPELRGRLDAVAMRVPTADVSIVDFAAVLKTETTRDEINQVFLNASKGEMSKYIKCVDEELVSIDFVGDTHSAIIDTRLTQVVEGKLAKVYSWYDNEWGYSTRVVDLIQYMASFMER